MSEPVRKPRKGHVTAVDSADAEMLVDVVAASVRPGAATNVARASIARFLADKREEWIACAMVRLEREFAVRRRKETKG